MQINNNEIYKEIKDVLKKHGIKVEVGEKIEIGKENNKKPYQKAMKIRISELYNPNYDGEKLCVCGHFYDRHFDSWEDNLAVGCKYCSCNHFVPVEEGMTYKIFISKTNELEEATKVEIKVFKKEKLKKELDMTLFIGYETQIEHHYEELFKSNKHNTEVIAEFEHLGEDESKALKEHFEKIKNILIEKQVTIQEVKNEF